MKEHNPPTKHHYIPAFYLKRWADTLGKVTEFSWPYRDLVARRIMPDRTGYQERLYELEGYEPNLAQQVEENFFKPLDTRASDALAMIERYGHKAKWDSDSRSAWTHFILSLMLRAPEDIALFRQKWRADFDQVDEFEEEKYQNAKTESDKTTFSEFLKNQPLSMKERYQYKILFSLIYHEKIVKEINNFHWRLIQITQDAPELLTSDRPILRTTNIQGPQGHIVFPIGPKLIFIASPDIEFLKSVQELSQKKIAKEINRQVVEGAIRFVYGRDQAQLPFVRKRFGRVPQTRLMENIQRTRK